MISINIGDQIEQVFILPYDDKDCIYRFCYEVIAIAGNWITITDAFGQHAGRTINIDFIRDDYHFRYVTHELQTTNYGGSIPLADWYNDNKRLWRNKQIDYFKQNDIVFIDLKRTPLYRGYMNNNILMYEQIGYDYCFGDETIRIVYGAEFFEHVGGIYRHAILKNLETRWTTDIIVGKPETQSVVAKLDTSELEEEDDSDKAEQETKKRGRPKKKTDDNT